MYTGVYYRRCLVGDGRGMRWDHGCTAEMCMIFDMECSAVLDKIGADSAQDGSCTDDDSWNRS